MAAQQAPERTYSGWQPERVNFLFGLTARQAAILGVAILAALLPVATTRLHEATVTWPAAIILALAATVRVQGRTRGDRSRYGTNRDDQLAGQAPLVPDLRMRGFQQGARPRGGHGNRRQVPRRWGQHRQRLLRDERDQPARRLAARRRPVRRIRTRPAGLGVR
jgi:hypothetical protein